jgi:hypothetical protein
MLGPSTLPTSESARGEGIQAPIAESSPAHSMTRLLLCPRRCQLELSAEFGPTTVREDEDQIHARVRFELGSRPSVSMIVRSAEALTS